MDSKKTILITGAAGYVGAMLVDQLAKRDDVALIIGIDKEPIPDLIRGNPKLEYFERNLADLGWEDAVREYRPDTVIHTAWNIREVYGDRKLTWKWNIEASDRVFDYVFSEPTVSRLIYFSTVASYGAFPSNRLEYRFTEEDPFRKTDYLYAEEKRIAEAHLRKRFASRKNQGVAVAVVRPAAITGPRGRFMRIRFGLQAALSGQLREGFVYKAVSALTAFVPVTPAWLRQFIHEDDVNDLVTTLAFTPAKASYEVFNICPPGPAVLPPDMARAVGKRLVTIHPLLVRVAFFFFWHMTRGKVPTGRGSWKGYSYPIAVDGSRLSREYGYQYRYPSQDAFYYTDGRYEEHVPEAEKRSHDR